MWIFLTRHSERSEESITAQFKNWILRQDTSLAQNDRLTKFAVLAYFVLLAAPEAHALTSISITADKITHENATLHNANIALDLTGVTSL